MILAWIKNKKIKNINKKNYNEKKRKDINVLKNGKYIKFVD